ncbi:MULTISPECIES: hypothetical protein [unclassified Pseudomonas]|uniref:hypothetical protein n=1 Tax=unclassified Pseudomonas TaxID=196821 RepID=UPI0021142709|nr:MULTISPECIES: hypothetical protein [unclassified Pseudomonas]
MSRTDQTHQQPTQADPDAGFPAGVALRALNETQPLDWLTINRYLHQQGLHVDSHLVPRQFVGGLANLNFLLRVNDEWAVLRRPPSGPLPPGANDMRREHRICRGYHKALPWLRAAFICVKTPASPARLFN